MTAWEKFKTPYGTTRYRHRGNPIYTLHSVRQLSGACYRLVWALFRKEKRMYEVQALGNLWAVRQEAEEFIEGAKSYAA